MADVARLLAELPLCGVAYIPLKAFDTCYLFSLFLSLFLSFSLPPSLSLSLSLSRDELRLLVLFSVLITKFCRRFKTHVSSSGH